MRYEPIERAPGSFQEPVPAETAAALCRRAFGSDVGIVSIKELPWGSYNNAYRVELAERESVVLRVAPRPARQFGVHGDGMRNEYLAVPYLAHVRELVPEVVFADFTQQQIGRDYMFQTVLPGVPAPEAMAAYERSQWAPMFEQIGAVCRQVQRVRGPGFGRVTGPLFDSWGESLYEYFRAVSLDVRNAGYDASDIDRIVDLTERHSGLLDEITEPRLLHGDGWTANVLVDPSTPALTLTGMCDWDRAEWGDPLADWAIQRALLRPGTERDAFWVGYGRTRPDAAGIRQQIYRARHVLELRLDELRLGRPETFLRETYDEIHGILIDLDKAG